MALADLVLGGLLLQPIDDLGAVVGLQDIPRLGFAETAVLMLSGVLVVGVDLHGELILRVDELGEQRETHAEDLGGPRADQRLAVLVHERAERLAGVGGVERDGISRRLPRLADLLLVRQLLAGDADEVAPAPDRRVQAGAQVDGSEWLRSG